MSKHSSLWYRRTLELLEVKKINRFTGHLNINSLLNTFYQLKLVIKNKDDILEMYITETKSDNCEQGERGFQILVNMW